YSVKELFVEWLQREFPLRAGKVLSRIRDMRDGALNDPRFESRMTGEGEFADLLSNLFDATCKKYDLNERKISLTTANFVRMGQLPLY
ncbi:MAG TPA: radical SAM protein, partial [Acidobacteriota bacterium]|nr:radical SAM protein [Acidobacteriota bacterium]